MTPAEALSALQAALSPARVAQVVDEIRRQEPRIVEQLPALPAEVRW
jgi:hypothetical protein